MAYDLGPNGDCDEDSEGEHCRCFFDGDNKGGFDCCQCGKD